MIDLKLPQKKKKVEVKRWRKLFERREVKKEGKKIKQGRGDSSSRENSKVINDNSKYLKARVTAPGSTPKCFACFPHSSFRVCFALFFETGCCVASLS